MRSKDVEFDFLSAAIAGLVLAGSLMTGCARDSPRNAAKSFFSPPSEQMAKSIEESRQDTAQSVIQQTSFEQKVAAPVWHDTLSTAVAEAQANNKLILADFTGSDWCHWCVKLKKDVFATPEFKAWANENVVLLELDYPRKSSQPPSIKEQNEMLKTRYNISSYPTVLLLDVSGNVRAKMGYEQGKSPAQWVQIAESRLQQSAKNGRSIANGDDGKMIR